MVRSSWARTCWRSLCSLLLAPVAAAAVSVTPWGVLRSGEDAFFALLVWGVEDAAALERARSLGFNTVVLAAPAGGEGAEGLWEAAEGAGMWVVAAGLPGCSAGPQAEEMGPGALVEALTSTCLWLRGRPGLLGYHLSPPLAGPALTAGSDRRLEVSCRLLRALDPVHPLSLSVGTDPGVVGDQGPPVDLFWIGPAAPGSSPGALLRAHERAQAGEAHARIHLLGLGDARERPSGEALLCDAFAGLIAGAAGLGAGPLEALAGEDALAEAVREINGLVREMEPLLLLPLSPAQRLSVRSLGGEAAARLLWDGERYVVLAANLSRDEASRITCTLAFPCLEPGAPVLGGEGVASHDGRTFEGTLPPLSVAAWTLPLREEPRFEGLSLLVDPYGAGDPHLLRVDVLNNTSLTLSPATLSWSLEHLVGGDWVTVDAGEVPVRVVPRSAVRRTFASLVPPRIATEDGSWSLSAALRCGDEVVAYNVRAGNEWSMAAPGYAAEGELWAPDGATGGRILGLRARRGAAELVGVYPSWEAPALSKPALETDEEGEWILFADRVPADLQVEYVDLFGIIRGAEVEVPMLVQAAITPAVEVEPQELLVIRQGELSVGAYLRVVNNAPLPVSRLEVHGDWLRKGEELALQPGESRLLVGWELPGLPLGPVGLPLFFTQGGRAFLRVTQRAVVAHPVPLREVVVDGNLDEWEGVALVPSALEGARVRLGWTEGGLLLGVEAPFGLAVGLFPGEAYYSGGLAPQDLWPLGAWVWVGEGREVPFGLEEALPGGAVLPWPELGAAGSRGWEVRVPWERLGVRPRSGALLAVGLVPLSLPLGEVDLIPAVLDSAGSLTISRGAI